MKLYEKILKKEEAISLVGLGYVGMPIAIEFAKRIKVIGYDINSKKIEEYKNGVDATNEVGNEIVANTSVIFTSDEKDLKEAKFHIVAVPTPINQDKTPNLEPIENASRVIGRNLTKGSIVVYESTVYPGATEEICIPILEEVSGLKCGRDFKVGYSPERINPGDKIHTLTKIIKVVSGMDEETLDQIAKIYELVIEAGVHKVSSIKVAEACKVVENSQRDINIAFMNELAMVFDKMDISTSEVINAMKTKWNALNFYPGLVGGHCIGVDPYYFISEAEKLGYHSQIISSGRMINDGMGEFVANRVVKEMVKKGKDVSKMNIAILGFTFKEDCPDTRNTKVIDIYNTLKEYDLEVRITDSCADKSQVKEEYGITLTNISELHDLDCIILAVSHQEYINMGIENIEKLFGKKNSPLLFDVKGIFDKKAVEDKGIYYWSL